MTIEIQQISQGQIPQNPGRGVQPPAGGSATPPRPNGTPTDAGQGAQFVPQHSLEALRQPPATAPTDPAAELAQLRAEIAALRAGQQPPAATAQVTPPPAAPKVNPLAQVQVPSAVESEASGTTKILLSVIAQGGVDVDRLLSHALDAGDERLIDQRYLKEVAGDKADHILAVAKQVIAEHNRSTQATYETIISAAGGKQAWDTAVAAFNLHADEVTKQFVKFNLERGNGAAVAKTVTEFARGTGALVQPGSLLRGGGGAPASATALSKAEFQKLHAALKTNDREYSAKSQELIARRQLGKEAGL